MNYQIVIFDNEMKSTWQFLLLTNENLKKNVKSSESIETRRLIKLKFGKEYILFGYNKKFRNILKQKKNKQSAITNKYNIRWW